MEYWTEIKGIVVSHSSVHEDSGVSFLTHGKSKLKNIEQNHQTSLPVSAAPWKFFFMDGSHVDPEVAPLYALVVTVRTFEWLLSGVD